LGENWCGSDEKPTQQSKSFHERLTTPRLICISALLAEIQIDLGGMRKDSAYDLIPN
jgi:hypothetical protein